MYSISDVMNDGLLWIDVETTGTGKDDLLLEVAMRASDMNGIILDDGCSVVMHHDDIPLDDMDEDVITMHTRNGLIDESLHHGVSVDQAKRILREYVMKTMRRFDVVYLAGYTVSFDRGMIQHHLKGVIDDMQHRMVDVTSFNIIAEHFMHDYYRKADGKYTDHRSPHCIQMEMDRYRYYIHGIENTDGFGKQGESWLQ